MVVTTTNEDRPRWTGVVARLCLARSSEGTLVFSRPEGRLTQDELDDRLGQALVSRAFHELMELIADLPVGPFGRLPAHPSSPPFPERQPALAPLVAALAWLALAIAIWAIVAA